VQSLVIESKEVPDGHVASGSTWQMPPNSSMPSSHSGVAVQVKPSKVVSGGHIIVSGSL
jgi:hypothetical protein